VVSVAVRQNTEKSYLEPIFHVSVIWIKAYRVWKSEPCMVKCTVIPSNGKLQFELNLQKKILMNYEEINN
jgi:hypothetical protein